MSSRSMEATSEVLPQKIKKEKRGDTNTLINMGIPAAVSLCILWGLLPDLPSRITGLLHSQPRI